MLKLNAHIFILPGLGNSGPNHWQSLWENLYHFQRVEQKNWDTPNCSDWIDHLNQVVGSQEPSNVILVGHSLACITVAFWAQKYNIAIKGALLVAPSDTEADTYPKGTYGFKPVPLLPLPFPSIVVASTDDPYVRMDRANQMAYNWGSEIVILNGAGHINSESNLADWPDGIDLLKKLDQPKAL